jgi:hypothetical protein
MGKVRVSTKGSDMALLLPQKSFNELGLEQGTEYDLLKAKPGIWVLVKREESLQENLLDRKILNLLKGKNLKERVEGKFEKFLAREELKRFKEMLKEGEIVAFKLSPKYKKAIYKTRQEVEENVKMTGKAGSKGKRNLETAKAEEKPSEEYSLKKDGFIVCKNVQMAKRLSEQLRKEIEKGKIRGIKGFDGFFYIAEDSLYQKYRPKVLSLIKAEKGIGSKKLGEKVGISNLLAKITCEFLKEEGEIIEKRKDQFQAI